MVCRLVLPPLLAAFVALALEAFAPECSWWAVTFLCLGMAGAGAVVGARLDAWIDW